MAETFEDFQKAEEERIAKEKAGSPPPAEGNAAVKEPVVIIDGKERPLKNYEEELKRKHEADMQKVKDEYEARLAGNQGAAQYGGQQVPDWVAQLNTMAEQEIATTGRTVPLQTILQAANQLSSRNVNEAFKVREQADVIKRSFLRKARSDSDWKDVEDDFNEIADQLTPNQVNEKTLDVVLLAAKGRNADKIKKSADLKARENAEKDAALLGQPSSGNTTSNPAKETLTVNQRKELERMNFDNNLGWTETEYLNMIKNKQEKFKSSGAKNIPQLLSDSIIK